MNAHMCITTQGNVLAYTRGGVVVFIHIHYRGPIHTYTIGDAESESG
jgi:hypothetical protein